MLVFTDPCYTKGHCVYFVPQADAIAVGHACAAKLSETITDAAALDGFALAHRAEDLDAVVEKIAKAMWRHWHNGGGVDVSISTGWKDVNQVAWKEQAKAALRVLGVEVP